VKYLLDANVFIQAKNQGFAFDVCPGFWRWVEIAAADRRVASVERVGLELRGRDDEVREWSEAQGEKLFLVPDQSVLDAMRTISAWVTAQGYRSAAVSEFLASADYYLIGHALAHEYAVVTHEVPRNQVTVIKIPNVCVGVGVPFMPTIAMLRHEKVKFVLES
jgi:hypothetical protein